MADYRQSCSNPACSYTGFTGHSPGCPVPEQQRQFERERQRQKDEEDNRWKDFFDSMTEEELFRYKKTCEDEIARVYRFKKRLDRVNDYIHWDNRDSLRKYLKWARDDRSNV